MFRAGGQAISVDWRRAWAPRRACTATRHRAQRERDAVRTACQLLCPCTSRALAPPTTHSPISPIGAPLTVPSSVVRAQFALWWAFTLVLADLNGFKAINDSLGHAVGDDLLRQFGLAMRRSVRSGDVPARIGGDEFAVILSNARPRLLGLYRIDFAVIWLGA